MYIDRDPPLTRQGFRIGPRLQIHVTEGQYGVLRAEADRSGLAMAELVRRAIDACYRAESRRRVRGLELNVGLFRDPDAAAVGRAGARR